MQRLLASNVEFLVEGGFLYVPLLYDPAVEEEIGAIRDGQLTGRTSFYRGEVLDFKGKFYVKALNLNGLPESYRIIHTDNYERLKSEVLSKYSHMPLNSISIDGKIKVVVFQVLPHFVRLNRGLKNRKKPDEHEILDLISEAITPPQRYFDEAGKSVNVELLREAIRELDAYLPISDPPRDGIVTGSVLNAWLQRVLESQVIVKERRRLRRILREREQFIETQRKHMASLLYIADKGSLDVNGFGFFRRGSSDHYIIYKHTGEYALVDYYGHIYIFPDCRVAVDTSGPLRPLVIDTYKHPLLPDFDSWQKICVRRFYVPETEFTARNVISALEEGISALFYGYNNRHHNGYYKLETKVRHIRTLDFDDYIVPSDHPSITSGEIEIKNSIV